jgi:urease accessory protein
MFEATRQSLGDVSALPAPRDASPRDRDLQRANGVGHLVLRGADVVDVYQKFPTRIMLPTTGDGATREAVIINAAGGIAGGDRLELDVAALGNHCDIAGGRKNLSWAR